MKRTPLKRKSTLTRKPLAPGVKRLRRSSIKRVGKRREREAEALEAFREGWPYAVCELCGARSRTQTSFWDTASPAELAAALVPIQAHHLCSRARGVGHPELHNTKNRAWLCAACHAEVHRGLHPELIRGRDFLDSLSATEAQTP